MKEMMNEGEGGGGGENKNKNMIWNNRWFVLVAAIWLQACAGIGYMFGAISPVMKTSLGYNQKQINRLGVAKDIGDSVGLLAGLLCDVLPTWALLFLGALQNFVGYGWIWLIVTGRTPTLPFALVKLFLSIVKSLEKALNKKRNEFQFNFFVVGCVCASSFRRRVPSSCVVDIAVVAGMCTDMCGDQWRVILQHSSSGNLCAQLL
jgi:hypothetical protein